MNGKNSKKISCKKCREKFQMIPQELHFYQKQDLSMPELCPHCRMQRRLKMRNEQQLYQRKCDKCGANITSVYPQETKFIVFCQSCYQDYIRDK